MSALKSKTLAERHNNKQSCKQGKKQRKSFKATLSSLTSITVFGSALFGASLFQLADQYIHFSYPGIVSAFILLTCIYTALWATKRTEINH